MALANGYSVLRTITLDHTKFASTLTDFTVALTVTTPALKLIANGGYVTDAQADDVILTSDVAGTTLLSWEVESYDGTAGTIVVHLKIASASHVTDPVVYMFIGKSGVTTFQSTATDAWKSAYVAVYHLAETGTNPTVLDSTSNNNDSASQLWTPTTAGKIGPCGTFVAASNNGANLGTPATLNALQVPLTISGWFYPTTATGYITIFAQYKAPTNHQLIKIVRLDSGALTYYLSKADGTFQSFSFAGANPTQDAWNYFAVRVGGSAATPTLAITLNGSTETFSPAALSTTPDTTVTCQLGNSEASPASEGWSGKLDAIRIANADLGADWIASEYANGNSPSTFYTVTGGGSIKTVITGVAHAAYDTTTNLPLKAEVSSAYDGHKVYDWTTAAWVDLSSYDDAADWTTNALVDMHEVVFGDGAGTGHYVQTFPDAVLHVPWKIAYYDDEVVVRDAPCEVQVGQSLADLCKTDPSAALAYMR
jgi:hypothetical protein